ncbi:hypothetical protein AB0M41_03025 [Streptomyces sp. NPDC051896]|uniref:hypothetical protein n=1 Tax=Streptomyces sp. NPDC051896 TaxID=3155416 RepID=UPI00341EB88F
MLARDLAEPYIDDAIEAGRESDTGLSGTGTLPLQTPDAQGGAVQEIADAAVGFPTVTFTAVLVVVAGFWVRVLLTRSGRNGRRSDTAADALGRDGVAAMAAASVVLGLSWIFSLAGSLLLRGFQVADPLHTGLAVLVLVVSLALAILATRLAVRTWRHHHG